MPNLKKGGRRPMNESNLLTLVLTTFTGLIVFSITVFGVGWYLKDKLEDRVRTVAVETVDKQQAEQANVLMSLQHKL